MGGGMFLYDSRIIAIDPDWPFKGDELLLTLEHEYGHALALKHRWTNSIMKPGWDPPFAQGPTEEDFKELQKMYGSH
jgi:predicted Zn-dependent protease